MSETNKTLGVVAGVAVLAALAVAPGLVSKPAPRSGPPLARRAPVPSGACACATGKGSCEWLRHRLGEPTPTWEPAPVGATLAAEEWRGAGCRAKPCVEMAGEQAWPEECAP